MRIRSAASGRNKGKGSSGEEQMRDEPLVTRWDGTAWIYLR
jgi:hypothetical protein